jgi:glycerophosphoryl diester phosphodiesterase
MVRAHGLNDSVTITSFHKHWLQEAADYDDVLPKGWLVPLGQASQWDDSIIDESKKMDISQICPRADITTPELVSKIRDAGFVVRCHGLINEELMRHAVDVGAAGGTVNFPDKLSEYLKASGIEQVK